MDNPLEAASVAEREKKKIDGERTYTIKPSECSPGWGGASGSRPNLTTSKVSPLNCRQYRH